MSVPECIPVAEALQIVMVGSFNPAIFHPEWFLKQRMIGEDESENATIRVVSSTMTDVTIGEIQVTCVSNRLQIGTANVAFAEKVKDMVLHLLQTLPHMHIEACGINSDAHYRIATHEHYQKIGHTLVPKELVWNKLYKKPGMLSLSLVSPREDDFPGAFNVTVEPSRRYKPGLFVRVNCHFSCKKSEIGGTEESEKFVSETWDACISQARKVAETIFTQIPADA